MIHSLRPSTLGEILYRKAETYRRLSPIRR